MLRVLNTFQSYTDHSEIKNQARQLTSKLSLVFDSEMDKLKQFTRGDKMIGCD